MIKFIGPPIFLLFCIFVFQKPAIGQENHSISPSLYEKEDDEKVAKSNARKKLEKIPSALYFTTGIGFPEWPYIGVRAQVFQFKLGVTRGYFPGFFSPPTNYIGMDLYYHWGGKSRFSFVKPWYGRFSIGREIIDFEGPEYFDEQNRYYAFRLGREINFSEFFGMQLDVGLAYRVRDSWNHQITPPEMVHSESFGTRCFSAGFFFRIQ